MPVFHTKTIESILEPVAQQVSKLVILHEEAEDGNAIPDLSRPVRTVKLAVDNLVRVGYETINSSEDQILKQDMPPALSRVEEASHFLLQASDLLSVDPFSAPARKKLIEGSRGILQGTSALLLAFDESEVRKIIRVCKNVLEYLAITEVVERMEDLVTYVKNLSPVLTKMTKEVDAREKELTHQVHRDMLLRSLDQVKTLTPVLISGIKIYITAKQSGAGIPDSQTNRNYVVHKMSEEIYEIIRVLQLTTYDEEEWDADDLAVMKKAENTVHQKMKQAQDWLSDPSSLVGSAGDRSLHQILEEAHKVADRCTNPRDRDAILKSAGDIESMTNALSELRQQGQGNSPQAMSLARELQHKMHELENLVHEGILNTERSGIRRPAPTVEGKVEQAQRWLINPGLDDKGLGEQATRMVILDGRHVAQSCTGPQRSELLRNCDEAEIVCNQLTDLIRKGQGDTPQAKAVAHHLSDKLRGLKNKIQEALLSQVAEDFIDITTPLKQLNEAAIMPLGAPGRVSNFDDKCHSFQGHSTKLADTAKMVATAGGCRNKKTVEEIFKSSKQVNDLAPQVVTAARILFSNPNNQAAVEHFELLKKQWTDQMERLRGLVDEAVDTAALVKAEEEGILRDTERVEDGIRTSDSPKIVQNASNIARRANRVLQVAQQEAENSEDPLFVNRVSNAAEDLKRTIAPMVQNAKTVSMNPRDGNACNNWRKTNHGLIDAVGQIREAVTVPDKPGHDYDHFPPPPDLSQLHISAAPPHPPQKFDDTYGLDCPPLVAHCPPTRYSSTARVPGSFGDDRGRVPQEAAPPHPPQKFDDTYGLNCPPLVAHCPPTRYSSTARVPGSFGDDQGRVPQEAAPPHPPQKFDDTYGLDYPPLVAHCPPTRYSSTARVPGSFGDDRGRVPQEAAMRPENQQFSHAAPCPLPVHSPPPTVPPPPQEFGYYGDEAAMRPEHQQFSHAAPCPLPVHSPPPPVPPPPQEFGYYGDEDGAPPRPPFPQDTTPPRPPPPETDDEDEAAFPIPQANQPIMMAAHALHMEAKQWSSKDNEIIAAAKRMALLMAQLSQLVRGEGGTKKDLISTAKGIAEASEEVARLAKKLAAECTDKRMRTSLLQVCERIPTIGTQLKILSTVKATMLGAQGSEEDQEATEMLVGNAQNLMQAVKETVRAAEAASIKIRVDTGYTIRWLRKNPWYT